MARLQLHIGRADRWGVMDILSGQTTSLVVPVMQFMQSLFVMLPGSLAIAVVIIYFIYVTQSKHAIRRNYPVVGRFRYFFEHPGEFFRQYFFAMDREEMPFNRAQRCRVCRAANSIKTLVYEVGTIAHSCGVKEPRELRRQHARVVMANGLSVPLNELHPDVVDTVSEVVKQTDEVYAHAAK